MHLKGIDFFLEGVHSFLIRTSYSAYYQVRATYYYLRASIKDFYILTNYFQRIDIILVAVTGALGAFSILIVVQVVNVTQCYRVSISSNNIQRSKYQGVQQLFRLLQYSSRLRVSDYYRFRTRVLHIYLQRQYLVLGFQYRHLKGIDFFLEDFYYFLILYFLFSLLLD